MITTPSSLRCGSWTRRSPGTCSTWTTTVNFRPEVSVGEIYKSCKFQHHWLRSWGELSEKFHSFLFFRLQGAIRLQASLEAEADSTGTRPINWPDIFPRKNRPINWPEANLEASSEADCPMPNGRPVQKPIKRPFGLEKKLAYSRLGSQIRGRFRLLIE